MFKVIRTIALIALLLTPTAASAQRLGNNTYFPQFPNLIPAPIKLPRADLEIPYIEVIRTDEKTGLTRYYDPAALTQADLKYTRIPRYNPQTLFPNIALDLTRNRAGGPVPVVNYHRYMVINSNCTSFPADQKTAWVLPDLGAFSGMPILRPVYPQFYLPSAEQRDAGVEEGNKRYADSCWLQRVIDSAVLDFRFSSALYPGGDYAQVLRQYYNYRAALYKRLGAQFDSVYFRYPPSTELPSSDDPEYRRPFFFSKSADDPLFAVVAAHPGLSEVMYSPDTALIVVPFFLLTLDPSNLCALVPDQRGAPFAMCGFDLNAPPMVFVVLLYEAVGENLPGPTDPIPLLLSESTTNGTSMRREQYAIVRHPQLSVDPYQLLLRSYPHYFLAQAKQIQADKAKFVREHTADRYVETYEGALLAAQRIAARRAGGGAARDVHG